MFVIEDEIHADWHGQYSNFEEAVAEIRRIATIPWGPAAQCGTLLELDDLRT